MRNRLAGEKVTGRQLDRKKSRRITRRSATRNLFPGQGYGSPIRPEKIQEDYQKIRANDPSRPVFLNLGQGVAWDNYIGRGVRRNHPEDYPEYVKGADIVSFDIYPAVHDHADVAGK